ncbi:hypothetical protein AYK26_04420 [Euryarchaeota archaeon SM23-78]|nr:MAG: hypothetical protein AYK26_04420 [Euryarchaeota archaeon SM23-78]
MISNKKATFIYLYLVFFLKTFKNKYHEVVLMPEMLIVKAKVKEACGDMSVAADFVEILNERVNELVQKALWRAKENSRRTVMGKDV